ncbi:proline-rich protein HaeIII subfamily 1-like [Canis lupus familiaris]|uniref:proline-rich protein HaeIII subfamily 1-like n=1 Tax=Canis lupus familiaris TaxID=9615 RepID=UPI0018F678E6|nr:proline-rich protein HaeIII subfamily 1-like [Canis lupus familiaris]XP_038310514.1 proline-rich protein HaeIII subfamily 1-like [Canis lupus familiaris]
MLRSPGQKSGRVLAQRSAPSGLCRLRTNSRNSPSQEGTERSSFPHQREALASLWSSYSPRPQDQLRVTGSEEVLGVPAAGEVPRADPLRGAAQLRPKPVKSDLGRPPSGRVSGHPRPSPAISGHLPAIPWPSPGHLPAIPGHPGPSPAIPWPSPAIPGHPPAIPQPSLAVPGHLRPILAISHHLRAISRPSPGHLQPSPSHPPAISGPSPGHPRPSPAISGPSPAISQPSPAISGHLRAIPQPSPGHLRAISGPSPAISGPSPGHLPAIPGHLRAIPQPSPGHLRAIPGHLQAIPGHLLATPSHPPAVHVQDAARPGNRREGGGSHRADPACLVASSRRTQGGHQHGPFVLRRRFFVVSTDLYSPVPAQSLQQA